MWTSHFQALKRCHRMPSAKSTAIEMAAPLVRRIKIVRSSVEESGIGISYRLGSVGTRRIFVNYIGLFLYDYWGCFGVLGIYDRECMHGVFCEKFLWSYRAHTMKSHFFRICHRERSAAIQCASGNFTDCFTLFSMTSPISWCGVYRVARIQEVFLLHVVSTCIILRYFFV